MNDLKKFWNELEKELTSFCSNNGCRDSISQIRIFKKKQGLFFWEKLREIKSYNIKFWKRGFIYANEYFKQCEWKASPSKLLWDYCLACLGEERVKELIKELEAKEQ